MEPKGRQGRKAAQGEKLNCVLYVEGHLGGVSALRTERSP
jgi:hypothetical protein